MAPEPTPAGTVNGSLNWSSWTCSLVICTTAGLTLSLTCRTALPSSADCAPAGVALDVAATAEGEATGEAAACGEAATAAGELAGAAAGGGAVGTAVAAVCVPLDDWHATAP